MVMGMQIIEVDLKVPYSKRGAILSKIYGIIHGRVRDVHIKPPDAMGVSEVTMELEGGRSLVDELKRIIKEGRVRFRMLSEV